jgi:hypothetical protein
MNELEKQIKTLEEKLLHSDLAANPHLLDELLGKEFEEIGTSGHVSQRDEVINWLIGKEQNARWSLLNFRIKPLAPDLVLAIYLAKKISGQRIRSAGSLRSSIWKHDGSSWKMIFHQGTKVIGE